MWTRAGVQLSRNKLNTGRTLSVLCIPLASQIRSGRINAISVSYSFLLSIENLKQCSYLKCSYLKMGIHGNALAVSFFRRIVKRRGKLGRYLSFNKSHVLGFDFPFLRLLSILYVSSRIQKIFTCFEPYKKLSTVRVCDKKFTIPLKSSDLNRPLLCGRVESLAS